MKKLSLTDFPVRAEFPTHWGDEDSARHVNNLVYLRWAETARVQYFAAMGMDTAFAGDVTGPILGWQDCKYIFPMTHPDTALVGVRCKELKADRFILETGIFTGKHERIAAITLQSIVPYNYAKLVKAEMPQTWIDGIEALEKTVG